MSLRSWEPIVAEYSDKLGAYDEAVVFDDATADRLISAAQTLSSTLTTQGSDRTSWAATASVDFKGHYAEVFDTNSKAGSTDCTNISSLSHQNQRFGAGDRRGGAGKMGAEWVCAHGAATPCVAPGPPAPSRRSRPVRGSFR